MDPIFKKLNFKSQEKVVLVDAPESFKQHIEAIKALTQTSDGQKEEVIEFALVFGKTKAEMEANVRTILSKLTSDAIFWVAYPKSNSKTYRSDYNRDSGWELLGDWGMEPVRQVAIDQDWSALRFRKVENIRQLTRKFGLITEKRKP
ncbi:hypothetical protein [Cyclobacterium jeungdonense]|uniref:DUF3052 domain-containing protein n=1 Tax=Cyclobacterium jeungdonense TaxID=708087 RepID=A0ABT8C3B4_9BACT|nr:hypothetical protein [Cyclobacterium jeungdonense]MDN3686867.1 hypothetical protein [Cyclobacterium jeungdonense]